MTALIANEDLTIAFTKGSTPPDLVYLGDIGITDASVTTTTSTKCKAVGKKMVTTSITHVFNVATAPCPFSSATYDFIAGGAVIMPSALKCKAENNLVFLEGDSSVVGCIGSWKLKVSPFTVVPCACGVQINSAGQTKAKGS